MFPKSIRRSVLVLALSFTLASSPASAASPAGLHFAEELGRSAWSWLAGVLGGEGPVHSASVSTKHGCTIDPNGQPICETKTQEQSWLKHGCGIDPDGRVVCNP